MSEKTVYKADVERAVRINRPLLPLTLIGIGIGLLALNLFHISLGNLLWPLFVAVPGLLLLLPAYRTEPPRSSALAFLAVPGAFFLLASGLLMVMNVTNHFEAWAYAWTLIPGSFVAGAMYAMRHEPTHSIHGSGRRFLRRSAYVFMGMGAIFELLIFQSLGPWWPVLLVGLGGYLWLRSRRTTAQGATL